MPAAASDVLARTPGCGLRRSVLHPSTLRSPQPAGRGTGGAPSRAARERGAIQERSAG